MIVIIALYIILGIIALIILPLFLRVRLTLELNEELTLKARVLGYCLHIMPQKKKKYKLSDYTLKKIAKRDFKKAQKEAERKAKKKASQKPKKALTKEEKEAQKAKKRASRPPLPDIINLFISITKFFFPNLLGRIHFHVARIKLKVGGSDAARVAMNHFLISSALAPSLAFIGKHSNLHGMNRAEIDISPDFLSEEIKADVKLSFSVSIGRLTGLMLKTFLKAMVGYMRLKPSSVTEQSSPSQNIENTPSVTQNGEKTA